MAYPFFVTWSYQSDNELRGCIGTFEEEPLYQTLAEFALLAALEDDRFEPVTSVELPYL